MARQLSNPVCCVRRVVAGYVFGQAATVRQVIRTGFKDLQKDISRGLEYLERPSSTESPVLSSSGGTDGSSEKKDSAGAGAAAVIVRR